MIKLFTIDVKIKAIIETNISKKSLKIRNYLVNFTLVTRASIKKISLFL